MPHAAWMLLWYFFHDVDFLLHGGHDQVVLSFLIVFRLHFICVPRSFWSLGPLMPILKLMLDADNLLSAHHLTPLEISRNHWLAANEILSADHWQFEIIVFIQVCVFWSIADGSCGQPLFVSKLLINKSKENTRKLLPFDARTLLWVLFIHLNNKIITIWYFL